MKEIIFNHWKADALRCRNTTIGKIVKNYWRLHYDENKATVTFWQRPYDKNTDIYNERYRVFTIDKNSNLTMNISNENLDQSTKCRLDNYINLHLQIIPAQKRDKYIISQTHEFKYKTNDFIYVPNQTIFNTYGELIQLGDYAYEEIDKDFNKEITQLSKIFREKLNIIANLLNLNLSKRQIQKKYTYSTGNSQIDIPVLSAQEIYADMQTAIVTTAMFTKWQKFSYPFSPYFNAYNPKKPNPESFMDVRKEAQKAINKARKDIARMKNKLNYVMVKQNVNGPGI